MKNQRKLPEAVAEAAEMIGRVPTSFGRSASCHGLADFKEFFTVDNKPSMFGFNYLKYLWLAALAILLFATGQTVNAQTGKRPIIVIPGITGSELVNSETGEKVWFTFSHAQTDDLRLPMSPDLAKNRDKLVATDIIREIKLPSILPDIQIYGKALESLTAKGYTEATWDNPQATDVFYVFAYDWRRDNVESAQQLIRQIESVKTKLKRPDLKFNIIAHSMGGLIARYAAMYGAADLPANGKTPVPTWAGSRDISRVLLFGTPNEGSFGAFTALIKGYTIGGRNLPFVNDLTKDDVFTIPSLYQLLPQRGTGRFLDENLRPLNVDIYRPETWIKYGWGAISNPNFLSRLKDAAKLRGIKPVKQPKLKTVDDEILAQTAYAQVRSYLAAALNRAERFQQALDAKTNRFPIETLIYGSNCKETLDAVVLVKRGKGNGWRTITKPDEYKTSAGRKISGKEIKEAIYAPGDGRVPQHSLLASSAFKKSDGKTIKASYSPAEPLFFCEPHESLLSNQEIEDNFLVTLLKEILK